MHDPELESAYGTVYWAFDGWNGQLVRYDFSQPHGPGLMDHSIAQVRRYPDVQFTGEGPRGVLLGMAIDAVSRILYVSDPAGGKVLYVHIDSGSFARTARGEYPIYSSRLPSFEYSIYECVEWGVLAEGLETPSGVILHNGTLFVAEYESGKIKAFDVATGEQKLTLVTPEGQGLSGLAVAPINDRLFYSNSIANIVAAVDVGACSDDTDVAIYTDTSFDFDEHASLQDLHALPCVVSVTIPNITYFEQVHLDSGYAAHDPNVQNDTMRDPAAALLANRTDCWYDSPLNFDALLLGGYYCHTCLPDGCFDGGSCSNVQWEGFTCSNEYHVGTDTNSNVLVDGDVFPTLEVDKELTYRFIVNSEGNPVGLFDSDGTALVEAVEEGILRFSFAEMNAVVAPVVEITVSGGSFTSPYFTFHDSEGNSLDPSTNELLLIPGSTYRFINGGVSGSHPFFISDVGRREASTFNIVSEGSPSSGLSSSVPSLEFQLPADFVGTLIYYCVPHTSMTNNFQVFTVIFVFVRASCCRGAVPVLTVCWLLSPCLKSDTNATLLSKTHLLLE